MKKYNNHIGLFLLSLLIVSCNTNDVYETIKEPTATDVALKTGTLDFSKYVAVGASFTAGFTDNALFIAGQKNSYPNTLAKKFAMAGGGEFNQPLMNDNIGGLLIQNKPDPRFAPRLYFNGSGPTVLPKNITDPTSKPATPTTEATNLLKGNFNNFGIPGAKSYHFLADGYGSLQALAVGKANPYFVRMAPTKSNIIAEVVSKKPTFFTLSEIGGNDVLGYAIAGGGMLAGEKATNQTGNMDPSKYGTWDITDPNVFASTYTQIVDALTKTGAKGVLATIPYITSLPHFTTVPYAPLDPSKEEYAAKIPTLNLVFGALNKVFTAVGQTNRIIQFSDKAPSPVVIIDENLEDLSETIKTALVNNSDFIALVKQFGLPEQEAPTVAGLMGTYYGQVRQTTAKDLLVLPSSKVIGTINENSIKTLIKSGLSKELAAQFSAEGLTKPLDDNWVLTPEEQKEIKEATDAYNNVITSTATSKGLALVDFKSILQKAAKGGVVFDNYNLNTSLVTGGLVGLDGIHLTGRGYALMANEILKAIDNTYRSNFSEATNGLAKADNYPTNYSPTLK